MSEPEERLPEELDALVREMRGDALEQDEVSRLAARVVAIVAEPVAGPEAPTATPPTATPPTGIPATGLPWAWVLGAGASSILAIGAALWALGSTEPSTPSGVTTASAAPDASAQGAGSADARADDAGSALADAAVAPTDAFVATIPEAAATEPSARVPRAARPSEAATPPTPSLAEHELLRRARRALRDSPRESLDLANEARRAYPEGALGPEREMIAVDALLTLGREAEARARARELVRRWPSSPYADRVRARDLVER